MSERDSTCATIKRLEAVGIRVRPAGNSLEVDKQVNRLTPQGWQFRMTANWFVVSRCECGALVLARVADIKRGAQVSCGCAKLESSIATGKRNSIHGGRNTRLYKIWINMRRRCENESDKSFLRYGGRGVSVCEEWQSFPRFREWAMSNGYASHLTIDRFPNRSGNYEPENCRWATHGEQNRNKDVTRTVVYGGRERVLIDLCEEIGIPVARVKDRLRKGWPLEVALSVGSMHGIVNNNKRRQSVLDVARRGLSGPMRRVLHNLWSGLPSGAHLRGMSQHGGHARVTCALFSRGLIDREYQLTTLGWQLAKELFESSTAGPPGASTGRT